jgi:hypothetical protein
VTVTERSARDRRRPWPARYRLTVTPATIVGLLADEQRLRVFAAIALGASTVETVSLASGLDVAEVQSALPRLVSAGLVEQRDGLRARLETLRDAARDRPPRDRELPGATPEQAVVLRNFAEGGRIVRLPARAGLRRVVLEYLSGRFEPGVDYPEAAVNETLAELHDDYVTVRRLLVDERLLEREHGVYRRVAATAAAV